MGKAIKVSDENYEWLLHLASLFSKNRGKRATFDDVLNEIRGSEDEKGKGIMDLAGSWKDLSEREAKKIKREIKKRWKSKELSFV